MNDNQERQDEVDFWDSELLRYETLLIDNAARNTLEAMIRFGDAYPCWHDGNTNAAYIAKSEAGFRPLSQTVIDHNAMTRRLG